MPERQVLTESRPLAEATDSGGVATIQLINPGWGSSGYYSADVLSEAATARVFPAGLHMYLNHPAGDGSGVDKDGNRSVSDLAAVLVEDARTNAEGALVAPARVFTPWRPVLAEVKDNIGVSVRARGTAELGEAEGRRGLLITSLDEGLSVDFVVAAGRGGRILELTESARGDSFTEEVARVQLQEARNVGQWIESRLHLSLTCIADDMFGNGRLTREERIALSAAVGDGLTAFTSALEASSPQLYERDLWEDPDADLAESAPAGDTPPDPDAGTPPAAAAPVTPIQEDHMTEPTGAGAAPPLSPRQVLEAGQAQLRRQVAELTARDRARTLVTEALSDAWLPASTIARLSRELIEALPIVNDTLDEAALADRIVAARNTAETEMAEAMQAAGVGTPRGLGDTNGSSGMGTDPAVFEEELGSVFRSLGMSESAANLAAKGR